MNNLITSGCGLIILLTIFAFDADAVTENIGKCCGVGEILHEYYNGSFSCLKDNVKRQSVNLPLTDVIKDEPAGKCLELFSSKFFEIEFSNGTITGKTWVNETVFRKCCPLGYVYNTVKHSCDLKNDLEYSFVDQPLIKVGLPECHIIVDELRISLDNDNSSLPEGDYCEDETSGGFVRRKCVDKSVCDEIRCVKKCCPDGKSFINGSHCFDTYEYGLNLSSTTKIENPTESFAIIHNNTRCKGIFYVLKESRYQFNLLKDGRFQYWYNDSQSYKQETPTQEGPGYCMEYSKKKGSTGYFFFSCMEVPPKYGITKYPKILSCIFLALTIIIYLFLSQIKKLFGKILINYCVSTFMMFALLIYGQFSVNAKDDQCVIVGFGIVFVATVSFAWLNVMCIDIWLTFGSTKHSMGVYQRRKELKKLLIYTAYGWGMPLLLTILIYVLSITESLSDTIRPYVGTKTCFLEKRTGNYAQLIFLRLPHLLIQLTNAFLFLKTILYCLRIKNEIERINDNKDEKKAKFNKDKEKLFLILKLAVIMGISFIVDTITSFVDLNSLGTFWSNVEIVIDFINCLQGVYIFIIFICKKSMYREFLKKLRIKMRDAYMNNTNDSFTSTTRMSLKHVGDSSTVR
ncbi:unnamed protein product [Phyllotreta striolata]|uniref:G-protein coupled receptors family 2 profile 2 domain-containing protein n=1 Tax=Phyllotreta striolata TaxID=444603 RepID=A0A9N9T970_PHYSR|nr:unnamed protein product [Phyllotreta striolata]